MKYFCGRRWFCAILFIFATPLFAADGWYLLIPPRSDFNERADFLSGYKILDNEPLPQWGQQGAYDSASECEAVKHNFLMAEQRAYASSSQAYVKAVGEQTDPVVLRVQRFGTEARNANVLAFMASRCIRSNDPRLR